MRPPALLSLWERVRSLSDLIIFKTYGVSLRFIESPDKSENGWEIVTEVSMSWVCALLYYNTMFHYILVDTLKLVSFGFKN